MSQAKVFVRKEDQDNDDAVLACVDSTWTVSEVIQAALPLLFVKGCEPPASHLQLAVDGRDGVLKNRAAFSSLGVNCDTDTLVLRTKVAEVVPRSPPRQQQQQQQQQSTPSPRANTMRAMTYDNLHSGGSIASFATGQGPHANPYGLLEPTGRRMVSTSARATDSKISTTMCPGGIVPEVPAGTKRDDGLTMLTGTVLTPNEPDRLRRVHGHASPPHVQSSRDNWWGHSGGYGPADAVCLTEKGTPAKRAPGVANHASKATNLETATCSPPASPDARHPPSGGAVHVTPGFSASPTRCGRRRQVVGGAQVGHLDNTFTAGGEERVATMRVNAKRLEESADLDAGSRGYGLGAGLREKMTVSHVNLGVQPTEEAPVSHRRHGYSGGDNKTYQSVVGGLMHPSGTETRAPEEKIEETMQRKMRLGGRSSSPDRAASMEAPPVAPTSTWQMKRLFREKVSLCGGHGSKGELQYAWRQLSQGMGTLTTDAFCAAVAHEFSLQLDAAAMEALGHTSSRVSFADFCALCTQDNAPSRLPSEEPPASGLRCNNVSALHDSARRTFRTPYGVASDEVPKQRSQRRAF